MAQKRRMEIKAFEEDIKKEFELGHIRAPIHLSGGNAYQLIKLFKHITKDDWCFSTHRSHLHALLKGIPADWLKKEILAGRSMHIMNKEHKFFSSSIVAGCCPIALGVAMALKRKGSKNKVWCFIGDMAGESGLFHECLKYSVNFELPIKFVIEDNEMSTNTPTEEAWGGQEYHPDALRYKYRRVYPHIGVGHFVEFN